MKKIKGSTYSKLGEYEHFKRAKLGWGKSESWRIAREMKWADIKDTDLGKFLESL